MKTIKGRVDKAAKFYANEGNTERPCQLYKTPMQASREPELYDVSDFAEQRVVVTCQIYAGDAAWGVSDVSVDFNG